MQLCARPGQQMGFRAVLDERLTALGADQLPAALGERLSTKFRAAQRQFSARLAAALQHS